MGIGSQFQTFFQAAILLTTLQAEIEKIKVLTENHLLDQKDRYNNITLNIGIYTLNTSEQQYF